MTTNEMLVMMADAQEAGRNNKSSKSRGQKAAATRRANKEEAARLELARQSYKPIQRHLVRNIMTGEMQYEVVGTPNYLSVACEAYWCS